MYNSDMKDYNEQENASNREVMVRHAHRVLKATEDHTSGLSGIQLSKEMGVNPKQFSQYKSGKRDIAKAYLDTLYKFERVYQKYDYFRQAYDE